MSNVYTVSGLCFAYEDAGVLFEISFDVHQGAFFTIIGPNGSGKSTLLSLMAGIMRSPEGRIRFFDAPIENFSRKKLASMIGYVPQQIDPDIPFTVEEVVLFGRTPHLGIFGIETRQDIEAAKRAMEYTGIEHLARRRLDRLSGGERQRVVIARALCQEPEVLLLDEPTASLDISHQVRIMDILAALKKEQNITVIMVSHDINLAAMYCDTFLLLSSGRVVAKGSAGEVLRFDALEKAYGWPVLVSENPLGGMPQITPVPGRFLDPEKRW